MSGGGETCMWHICYCYVMLCYVMLCFIILYYIISSYVGGWCISNDLFIDIVIGRRDI